MIPILNRNATYKLSIPDLSGGLNLRDGLSEINDNQLSESQNMWYQDGMLKTRPRLKSNTDLDMIVDFGTLADSMPPVDNRLIVFPHCTTYINGKEYTLELYVQTVKKGSIGYQNEITIMYHCGNSDMRLVANINVWDADAPYGLCDLNCFAAQHNGDIYVYASAADSEGKRYSYIWKIERLAEGEYGLPTPAEAHIPLVLVNGLSVPIPLTEVRGDMVNGYNLLSDKYKMQYNLYDASQVGVLSESSTADYPIYTDSSLMRYALLRSINDAQFEGKKVTAKWLDGKGNEHIHEATITKGARGFGGYSAWEYTEEEESAHKGELKMCVINNMVQFYLAYDSFASPNDIVNTITKSEIFGSENGYINDSLEIIAPYFTAEELNQNIEKVTSMTRSEWYGNTSLGLGGGNRLFLGGSIKEGDEALILWSDFSNPLYFNENNYAYVGDKSQKVTAFGKQGSSLIIFKEREIYSAQYSLNNISETDIESQNVIDVSSQYASFPLTQVHSLIGCRCPNSVQLCRNRLVWADINGKIYTLTSQNQYSERNVFEIGQMIERELKTIDLSNANAIDWEGKYVLWADTKAFVMDYNSYGYANIASYNKSEDANKLVPWFAWEFDLGDAKMLSAAVNNGVPIIHTIEERVDNRGVPATIKWWFNAHSLVDEEKTDALAQVDAEGYATITNKPVQSRFKTKLFDFGKPDEYKNIYAVNISLGYNEGNPVHVKIENDNGESDTSVIKASKTVATERSARFFENKQILPFTRLCGRFSVDISCAGLLFVDAISIKYNTAGGIK